MSDGSEAYANRCSTMNDKSHDRSAPVSYPGVP